MNGTVAGGDELARHRLIRNPRLGMSERILIRVQYEAHVHSPPARSEQRLHDTPIRYVEHGNVDALAGSGAIEALEQLAADRALRHDFHTGTLSLRWVRLFDLRRGW